MRTTLVLDDQVVQKAKIRAAELGTTLSQLTNQALREKVTAPNRSEINETPFQMLTYGTEKGEAIRVDHIKALRDEGR